MSETQFIDLQKDVATRIKADPFFSAVPVMTDREENIGSLVQTALNVMSPSPDGSELSGACVIVMQPFANDFQADLPGGPLAHLVSVLCLEHLVLNRDSTRGTGKSVRSMGERLHKLFKHYTAHGLFSNFMPQDPFIVDASEEIAKALQDDMLRGIEVRFGTRSFDDTQYNKVSLPVITTANGLVTITCGTSSTRIYYTTDGTTPAPDTINNTASLYSAQFAAPASGMVRAGAYRTTHGVLDEEWIPSDTATLRFPVA
jgi:hypothetical protein